MVDYYVKIDGKADEELTNKLSKTDIMLLSLSITGFDGGLITDSTFGFGTIDLGGI